jgi:hypothetical protein
VRTSLFISLCILRDLEQQKIPRELCGGGDPPIFLCSHGKIFGWDGSGKFKNTRRRKGTDQEISKKPRRKEWRKEKEEIFTYMEVPIVVCVLHRLRTPSVWLPPLCDPSSGEPTGMGTSPTTKREAIYIKMLYVYVKMFQSPIDVSVFKISHFSFLVIILSSPKVQPVQYLFK